MQTKKPQLQQMQDHLIQSIQRKLEIPNSKLKGFKAQSDIYCEDLIEEVKPVTVSRVSEDGESAEQETVLQHVVVYQDRAEVTRSIKVKVAEGNNGFIVNNVSKDLDTNSVRVELRGPGVIRDVIVNTVQPNLNNEEKSKEVLDLEEKIKVENQALSKLEQLNHRLMRKIKMLDELSKTVATKPTAEQNMIFADANQKGIEKFFSMLDVHGPELDEQLFTNEIDIKEKKSTIGDLEKELNGVHRHRTISAKNYRKLVLIIEGTSASEIEIVLSYVVSNAKWTPTYDVRVSSTDKKMQITYHGLVQQSTGEAWDNVHLALSTALPNVGGVIPELGTQVLGCRSYAPPQRKMKSMMPMMSRCSRSSPSYGAMRESGEFYSDSYGMEEDDHTSVNESLTSTKYEVLRPCTILPDNDQHKVTVAIIDLDPVFRYETIPHRACYAFLKAVVKNTSAYVMLPGDSNVFLDSSFVAKGNLKAVHPQEQFMCSLGVDPAVLITYPPVKKFKEHHGYFYKNISTKHDQTIEIHNTHKQAIEISVSDHLPLSTDDKVKVTLQTPNINVERTDKKPDPNAPIRLNAKNNIEWDITVPSGEKKKVKLVYNVEHPAHNKIYSTFRYDNNNENFTQNTFSQQNCI